MSISDLFPWLASLDLGPLYAFMGAVLAFSMALATASLIVRLLSGREGADEE
jgi:hypothetical protein